MLKRKAGLQKEVSKIFTGVQIPKKDGHETSPRPAAPAPAKILPKSIVPTAPRPFTIPEPEQQTPPKAAQKVYEPPVPTKKVSEPPVPAQKVQEPPVPAQKVQELPAPAQKVYEPSPQKTGYEPPKPAQKVYEPPPPAERTYEPPAPAPAPAKQPRPELPSKSHVKIPGLKIWKNLKNKLLTPKPGVKPGRQKAMVAMIPVLFVVFAFVLFKVLRTPSASSTKVDNNVAASTSASFNGKIDWERPPPYPENLRDAMVFGPATQTQEENKDRPVVKGIVYSEDNPCAVVGDRIVSVGEVVHGATVVKINPDSVEFAKGDESWTQKVER